ncbi:hypothetical protein BDV28DRAFT_139833 [Aspergillus coremiiformis]|uniref:Uncharacterized protein n=1 Tax=Aspergillus coremiiformis TaxID=138285 RepID=A0A5N6YX98_9EURO|nr:hypothetical protein BDV28DRAFT_139833 [Aspergillus coremiiformis]
MVKKMRQASLLRDSMRLLPMHSSRRISSTVQRLSDTNKDASSNEPNSRPDTMLKGNPTSHKDDQQVKSEKAKTVSQADEELRQKLEQMSGGGGAAGIEYEDGEPNTMKRSVRNNMFRYI